MKLLVFADPHWCSYSSIVRSRGDKFSTRLENLIDSINYVEHLVDERGIDHVICLGDFFDRNDVTSEEISALDEIRWRNVPHHFIVGNHEIGRGNAEFSSSYLFNLGDNFTVVDSPSCMNADNNTMLFFLPYILEKDRKNLSEYFNFDKLNRKKNILFTHNDIKGIQMGRFISTDGFEVSDIESYFNLCVNGHIHNFSQVGDNIINMGNLTGQNFSEDGYRYQHWILIIDTEEETLDWIENPCAFNFYKIDFCDVDIISESIIMSRLTELRNAVLTIKCRSCDIDLIKNCLLNCPNVVEYKIILDISNGSENNSKDVENFHIDHLKQFDIYIKENVGNSQEIIEELSYIVGVN